MFLFSFKDSLKSGHFLSAQVISQEQLEPSQHSPQQHEDRAGTFLGLTQDRGSPKPKFPQLKTSRGIETLLLPQSVTGLLSAGSIIHTRTRRSSASSAQHPQRGSNGIIQRLLLTSNAQRDVAVAIAGLLPAVGGSTLGTAQGLRSAPC